VWWNDDQNWKNVLTFHEGWEEFVDHCLTHDPMPQTTEWHQQFDEIRALGAAEAHCSDTAGVAGSIPAVPTRGIMAAPLTKLW
jgi:hypothetical protein